MIFLDSSYLIGVILKKDKYTKKALELKPVLKHEMKLINNTVFNEVLNSLSAINSNYDVDELTQLLLSYKIDFLNADDYADAVASYKYYNHCINFSDCTILQTMIKHNVNTIVSFDSDFDKINGIQRIYL